MLFSICEHHAAYEYLVSMPEASELAGSLKTLSMHSLVLAEAGHTLAAMISGQFTLAQHCDATSCPMTRMMVPTPAQDCSFMKSSTAFSSIRAPVLDNQDHIVDPYHARQQDQEPVGAQAGPYPAATYPALQSEPRNTRALHLDVVLEAAQHKTGLRQGTNHDYCASTIVADRSNKEAENSASIHVTVRRCLCDLCT